MEDDLEKIKLDFISNYLMDHNQILNSSSGDQKETTSMEDDLHGTHDLKT